MTVPAMPLLRAIGQQLSFPVGRGGRAIGALMDLANRRPVSIALDLLDAAAGERVLDVGCGTGAASQQLMQQVACVVTGVDRSPIMLRRARQRHYPGNAARFQLAALGALPFADASFDAALALNLLYFCDDEGAMLADLKRVLRPGGRVVAYVTHRATMAKWPFIGPATHRLYDAEQLTAALMAGGFAPERITVQERRINRHVRGLLALALA